MINISVCIIGRNEENTLDRCLSALQPYPFEIVFTDTGSTDSTKEIASKYTDKVFDFEWVDDFSAARNYCAEKASNDWILCIDCDEYLEEFDLSLLDELIAQNPDMIGAIIQRSYHLDDSVTDANVARLYNRQKHHFVYPIHEQIATLDNQTKSAIDTGMVVLHSGYCLSKEENLAKQQRNIALLEKHLLTCPEETRPYYLFQLGTSYSTIDKIKAAKYLKEALSHNVAPSSPYYVTLVINYAYLLIDLRDNDLLSKHLSEHAGNLQDYSDFHYLMGYVHIQQGNYLKALESYLQAPQCSCYIQSSTHGPASYYNIGLLLKGLKEYHKALSFLHLANGYLDSKEVMEEIMQILRSV